MKKHGAGSVQKQGMPVKGAKVTGSTGNSAKSDASGTGTKSGSKNWVGTGKA
jgi:hypothetical protein